MAKRPDGYHNIESVFYPVNGLNDVLEVTLTGATEHSPWPEKEVKPAAINYTTVGKFTLGLSGLPIEGNVADNILTKAYNLIDADYNLPPITAHLHKVIPMGAGLGGGSANAAYFIKLIDQVAEIGLAWGEKHHYARLLGADCSFFINNRPAFCFEKGDQFEHVKLDLAGHTIAIVKPPIHVATAQAYQGVTVAPAPVNLEEYISTPITDWKNSIGNAFEVSVAAQYPVINTIKETLYSQGAIYAQMSGSGSAVYGIFAKGASPQLHFTPDCFVWQGIL